MRNRQLFRSTTLRLTSVYLIILMSISLVFSFGLYQVGSDELERGIRKPNAAVERLLRTLRTSEAASVKIVLEDIQNQEISDAQNRLRNNLILINLFILFAGGLLSYVLARRSLEPIEQAHEAQSRFTADASHELRTPITAMRAETEISLTDPKLTLKQAKKQLESNIEELDKLTDLSENLLQLARLDGDEIDKEKVELDAMIAEAVSRIQTKADKKKQSIEVSGEENIEFNANHPVLVGAIVTLLDNASKYSGENSKIEVKKKLQKGSVAISISDNGSGVDKRDLPFIFDRFYRADQSRIKTAETQNGYGIGLSLAKAAVEAHKGSINVQSSKKGTTFTIQLPR